MQGQIIWKNWQKSADLCVFAIDDYDAEGGTVDYRRPLRATKAGFCPRAWDNFYHAW
jgi:hypothetical protein